MIERAVDNLLRNAQRFNPQVDRPSSCRPNTRANSILISVCDHGPGVDAEMTRASWANRSTARPARLRRAMAWAWPLPVAPLNATAAA